MTTLLNIAKSARITRTLAIAMWQAFEEDGLEKPCLRVNVVNTNFAISPRTECDFLFSLGSRDCREKNAFVCVFVRQ